MSRREAHTEQGFTLVEILVAIILLTIALSSLASLSYQVAQRSLNATSDSFLMGVATDELGYLSTLPFDSLPAQAGCTTVADDNFPHELCIAVADVSDKMREIKLIITPDVPLVGPDTIVVRRSAPAAANPFS